MTTLNVNDIKLIKQAEAELRAYDHFSIADRLQELASRMNQCYNEAVDARLR